jgi:hypothetical protein
LAFLPARIEQDGADAELVMAFPEGGGTDHHALAHDGFGRELPVLDRRLHGGDRKAAKSKTLRDQGLRLLLGHGTGSRVIRHRLDVIYKSSILLSLRSFFEGFRFFAATNRHFAERNRNP